MDITLKVRPDNCFDTEAGAARGDYIYGDKQDCFLRPDWTLAQVRSFINASNEPMVGLSLTQIDLATWDVLESLLPEASKELRLMKSFSEYEDLYTSRFSCALYPMVVLTRDWSQYQTSGKVSKDRVEFSVLDDDELHEMFDRRSKSGSMDRLDVGRVPQVIMGTGYTRSCMPSDGSAVLEWQFAELTNGDILVLAGYEWFNK